MRADKNRFVMTGALVVTLLWIAGASHADESSDNWTYVRFYEEGLREEGDCTPDMVGYLDFEASVGPLRCTKVVPINSNEELETHMGYGDETGIVRARVGNRGHPVLRFSAKATLTDWNRVYHKIDDDTSAKYTIGNNKLEISTQDAGAYAGTSFHVRVTDLNSGAGYDHVYDMDYSSGNERGAVQEAVTWMSNQSAFDPLLDCDDVLQPDAAECDPDTPRDPADTTINGWAGRTFTDRTGDLTGPEVTFGDGVSADVSMVVPHTQVLDLSMIPNYDSATGQGRFSVSYGLIAQARARNDGFVRAYFSDPLDVTGRPADGVSLSMPFDPQPTPARTDRVCQQALDAARYEINQDLVLDTQTGLQWQRCPVGYTLTGGSTSDLLDDDCVADGSSLQQSDWPTAVQLAEENTDASQTDWRLPDIKELDSIVAECQRRKIDPALFPDTPTTLGAFWTSTVTSDSEAWQVHFVDGTVQPIAASTPGYARLVRTSNAAPLPDVPVLYAGHGRALEGDSGTTQMRIPVLLSKPPSTLTGPITVSYAVTSPNQHATPGVDFEPVSGSLSFAPGEQRQTVEVTIIGDAVIEPNEFLNIALSNPSSNSRLGRAINVATIYDDEPTITFARASTQLTESDSGTTVQSVPVLLSKPAVAPITVGYDIEAGTADLTSDAQPGSGTVSFAVGESLAFLEVTVRGDTTVENDESLIVRLREPNGGRFALGQESPAQRVLIQNDDALPDVLVALNDTGARRCADNEFSGVTCPVADFPLQDAEQGRDVDPALNDDTDGSLGFSFTRLDAAGVPMANQVESYLNNPWFCAEDNVTGLVWEVKIDANTAGLHQATRRFSWYNSTGINDGGDPGREEAGACATESCDSERYVAAVNAENYCGFDDWRVPTITELLSVFDQGRFPAEPVSHALRNQNVASGRTTMSSTTALRRDSNSNALVGTNMWTISSNGVSARAKDSVTGYQIRLVRGGAER